MNVIAGRVVVPEFLQNEAKPRTIAHEALFILKEPEAQEKTAHALREVRLKLGKPGADKRAAQAFIKFLSSKT